METGKNLCRLLEAMIEVARTGGGGGGADGVMVAERACPVLALVVAYAKASGVVVDSTHPSG